MNPYAMLAAGIVGLGLIIGAFFYGQHVENAEWEASIGHQKVDAANLLTDKTKKVLELERENGKLVASLEKTHADDKTAIDGKDRDLRAALARMRAQSRQGCGGGGVGPGGQGSGAAGDSEPAAGSDDGLAGRIDGFSVRCARGANILASLARECHNWATQKRTCAAQ